MLNNTKIFFTIKNSLYLCSIKSKDMKNFCLCRKVLINSAWVIALILLWIICCIIVWSVTDMVFGWINTSFTYGAKICTVIMYTCLVIAGYYSSMITEKLNKKEK